MRGGGLNHYFMKLQPILQTCKKAKSTTTKKNGRKQKIVNENTTKLAKYS